MLRLTASQDLLEEPIDIWRYGGFLKPPSPLTRMASKSVRSRADNRRQRQRMNMSRYSASSLMVRPEQAGEIRNGSIEVNPPSRDKIICAHCGFTARYRFLKCPECQSARDLGQEIARTDTYRF